MRFIKYQFLLNQHVSIHGLHSSIILKNVSNLGMIEELDLLKGTNGGVLFQNADRDINMGVWFDDPDIEMNDIYFYNLLAQQMDLSQLLDEGLVTKNKKYNTKSCYVELHRNGELNQVLKIDYRIHLVIPNWYYIRTVLEPP